MDGGCSCWECRKAGGLRAVAPFLSAMWELHRELAPQRFKQRRYVLHLRQLVAHRELHLARSLTRKADYVQERREKLSEAQRWLRNAERRLEAM